MIRKHQSSPQSLTRGVRQGSILGPLLLVYVNNIYELSLDRQLSLYADYICMFCFGHNLNLVIQKAQNDLNVLHK